MNLWFPRKGVEELLKTKKAAGVEPDSVTLSMLAAYLQFDDIEFLLDLVKAIGGTNGDVPDDVAIRLAKVAERHERYRARQNNGVVT